jgi:hypothetical protein
MRDGGTAEIPAWLRRLPPRDRLATMYAISAIFPALKKLRSWKVQIDAVVAELKPTAREHDDIMSEAGRISRNLRRVLRAQEPKQ